MDFTMSNLQVAAYIENLTEAQRAFFASFPLWVTISWAIAVWGAVLGSLLLLLRKKLAVPVFLISLLAMALTSLHNYVLSDIKMQSLIGLPEVLFSAAIVVVGGLLVAYARAQAKNGHLR